MRDSENTALTMGEEFAGGGNGAPPENTVPTSAVHVICKQTADIGAIATQDQQKDTFLKTSLCSYFRKTGNCRHGDSCRYAHGEAELRVRPDGSWDPTSVMAKVASKKAGIDNENGEGKTAECLRKCIRELPLNWTSENLSQLLAEKEISFVSFKKRPFSSVGFVEFGSDEHVAQAKQKLDGFSVDAKILKLEDTSPQSLESEQIRDAPRHPDGENAGDKKLQICDSVTPLANLPYQQQLDKKSAEISQLLKKLVRNVRKAISPGVSLPEWVNNAKVKAGLCCTFDGIIPSPLIDGYRNKCEFTIGHSYDGKRVVGFLLGNFREGRNIVIEPDQCRNVSTIAKTYAKVFQKFIEDSALDVWDKKTNSGFWRLFTVREGHEASATSVVNEVMLIVQICSTGVDEETRSKEYNRMAHDLALAASGACPQLPLSALLVQDHLGISNVASPDAPLIPIPIPSIDEVLQMENSLQNSYIHDHINNLQFRISPTSFFQVNTSAAEKLYNLAGDWAGLDSQTLLFDVCCGTGTIGLTLAHRVGLVIGIEMNAAAIADAHTNAEINGIQNCKFVCGKAEDVIQDLLDSYLGDDEVEGSAENDVEATPKDVPDSGPPLESSASSSSEKRFRSVVVLVDPPRSGLHPVVVKSLRAYERIRRLVYISCNPETLLANAVELCTPNWSAEQGKGGSQRGPHRRTVVAQARQRVKSIPTSTPFSPVKAMAVDMFPHTPHCEMVMLMER